MPNRGRVIHLSDDAHSKIGRLSKMSGKPMGRILDGLIKSAVSTAKQDKRLFCDVCGVKQQDG